MPYTFSVDPAIPGFIIENDYIVYTRPYAAAARTAEIPSVSATVTAPVIGAKPVTTATSGDSTKYTVAAVSWEPASSTFEAGEEYSVLVMLEAKDGFKFAAAPAASINGQTAVVVSGGGTEELKIRCGFARVDEMPYFPFEDVPESAWYYKSVKGAYEMGLINGKTETLYKPADNMTYAEAIKLAACMHQLYTEGEVTLANGTAQWYSTYYDYCRTNGIIPDATSAFEPGYSDLLPLANTLITRREYALLFSRALPDEALPAINDVPDESLPDVSVRMSLYGQAVYKLYRAGIVNGVDAKGTFKPESNIQRSEVAAILIRMMDPTVRVGAPSELGK